MSLGYDGADVEAQHYRGTFRDNGMGANEAYSLQDIAELEPAGGIGRSEQAELLAILVHEVRAEIDQTTPGDVDTDAVRVGFELSRDEDIGVLTDNRTQVDLSNNAFEGDAPSSQALSRQIVLADPDILWFAIGRGEQVINSAGEMQGAHLYSHGPEMVPFKSMFSTGPVFQASDSVHLHGRVNSVARSQNWVGDIMFSMYWVVHEQD